MSAVKKFGIISSIMLVCIIGLCAAFYMLLKANRAEVNAYENQYKSYLLADEMRQNSDDLTRLIRTYTVTKDESYLDQYNAVLDIRNGTQPRPKDYQRIYWDFVAGGNTKPRPDTIKISLLDLMKQTGFTKAELDMLAEAQKRSTLLVEKETLAMELIRDAGKKDIFQKEADIAKGQNLTHDRSYHRDKAHIMQAIDDFYVLLDKRISGEIEDANTTRNLWKNIVLVTLGILIVVIAVFTVFFSHILKQLGEDPGYLYNVSNEIAGGNLDVSFREKKKKIGVYAVFCEMVATMKGKIEEAERKTEEAANESRRATEAMEQAEQAQKQAERAKAEGMLAAASSLEEIVERVSSASQQLSAQILQTNKGADQQNEMTADAATAMEEMSSTVLEVARNASSASENADKARNEADGGRNVVNDLVEAIRLVYNESKSVREKLSGLGGRAESIGQIMNVISDIADQTNLLALNAAIEAARAGEAGRGFAVVADEVRKLAENTMSATRDVAEAIDGIQHEARETVEAMDLAGTGIERSNELADKAGTALFSILDLVVGTADQIRNIATASEEQSAASEEINNAIHEIHSIAEETAGGMEEANAAVSELAQMSSDLKKLIHEMKEQSQ